MKSKFILLIAMLVMSIVLHAEIVWRDGTSADVAYGESYSTRKDVDQPRNFYTTADDNYDNYMSNGPSRIRRGADPGGTTGLYTFNPAVTTTADQPVGDALLPLTALMLMFAAYKFVTARKKKSLSE